MKEKIEELIGQMTLEEKAGLCSGLDFWRLKGIERLRIPSIMVTDGPHGLRKQEGQSDHLGLNASAASTCFPTGATLANSWDTELIREVGQAIAQECLEADVQVVLGPSMNIKRTPLCGRNFEYFSEDPWLSGSLGAAYIQGVQSMGIGACVKHFAANNQETRRFSVNAKIDKRTFEEIYLSNFEWAVTLGKPWSVMSAFNKVNGISAFENKDLLTDVLKKKWKFDGAVMTDWAAMNHRVKSLLAGLDLEMPGSGEVNDKKIVEAVRDGNLEEPMLDDAVRRILRLIFRTTGRKKIPQKGDLLESHHELAKKAAAESIVLLKNDGGLLPLHPDLKIALIGPFAEESRYQGGGSSHINPYRLEHLIDVIRDRGELHVTYCKGFNKEDNRVNGNLELEALNTAGNADLAIVYLGLPDSCESESFDRKDMCLPPNQSHLMEELLKVQKNIVVILAAGAPVEMPWALKVPAILQGYLFGQAGAGAMYNILTGKITPSGKLAETYPLRLKDNPSYLNFPGDSDQVSYHEGIYVGYRYYEKKEMKVAFPFGHGLSYTAFTYKKIELDSHRITDMDELTIAVTVRNAGSRPGKETVQLYVASPDSIVSRPVKELKGFQKAELQPGEEHKFVFHLNRRAFAYYDTELDDWFVEEGTFRILAGTSSADIRLEDSVFIRSTVSRWKPLTLNSTIEDLMGFPEGKKLGIRLSRVIISDLPDTKDTMDEELISEGMGFDVVAMVGDLQLKMLILFSNGSILEEEVQKELNSINKQYENQGE